MRDRTAVALLLLLVAALYANSLGGAFQLDDTTSIVENRALRAGDWGEVVAAWPTRALAYLGFALDHRVGGLSPLPYHLHSVLVFALAVLALYGLLRRLLGDGAAARSAALLGAALWAAHPLQVQSVAYIVQRANALAALFYLASCFLWLESGRPGRRGAAWLAAALLCGLAGQFSKEWAMLLPLGWLLVEWAARPAGMIRWRAWALSLPLAAVVPLLAAGGAEFGVAGAELAGETRRVDRLDYWVTQWEVAWRYLGLWLWPAGLNVDHHLPWRSFPPGAGSLLLGAGHLLLLGVAAGLARAGCRLLAAGILWFYLGLLPEGSIFPILDPMFEHRMLLPSAGLALLAAVGLRALLARRRAAGWLLAGVLLLALGATTVARNRVWATPRTLWEDAASKSPGKSRPRMALGIELAKAGEVAAARRELEAAVRLDPGSAKAATNLGNLEMAQGRPAAALPHYRRATQLRADHLPAWYNLGVCQHRLGDATGARGSWERVLELDPRHGGALNGLASLALAEGDLGRAEALARRAQAAGEGAPALLEAIRRRKAGG